MASRVAAITFLLARALAAKPRSVLGKQRLAPLAVLRCSNTAKDIRRAETAWRKGLGDGPAPLEDADAALRALGSVADGPRVRALLRRLDKGGAYSPSAAIASLALCGDDAAAERLRRAVAAGAPPDSVALGLAGTAEIAEQCGAKALAARFGAARPACLALYALQRRGILDFHGLKAEDAVLALEILLDDEAAGPRAPVFPGDVLVVTGRGRHSPDNVPSVRPAVLEALEQRRVPYEAENEGAVRLFWRR